MEKIEDKYNNFKNNEINHKKEIIIIKDITKSYQVGEVTVPVLRGISFSLYEGEFVVILGPSGSGKSTMLNMIGGIDSPTMGQIIYNYKDISKASEKMLTKYRKEAVGFVFQFYNLLQNLTAKENITISAELSKNPLNVDQLLQQIGMDEHKGHFPAQMSGGQQQRIAIARAIAKNPDMLLCDEPTGALDSKTSLQVLRLLKDFNTNYKKTIVIITHNIAMKEMANRVIYIRDGLLEKIEINENPIEPETIEW
ncbi:MAG: ABC transporter ATP-binding protein [Defluviitaleaceae bacterium]|nr:ABC transporter ATP-binding protein [Defluviitaleaceae bacterium]